ncbi:MAG TPA: hypothetical protein VMG41_05255 [Gemmatimonadales bacterium]|nr:hypothetical protein [Gemmatimonadales bacterium]
MLPSRGGWDRLTLTAKFAGPAIVVVLALVAVDCESPTAPRSGQSSERIAVGTTVSGSLSGSDSLRIYSFPVAKDSYYVVLANVTSGGATLVLRDSGQGGAVNGRGITPNGLGLYSNLIFSFAPASPGVWSVEVHDSPHGAATSFQLLVFLVNRAPEIAPPQFAIGDTVRNETIDVPADIDIFTAHVDSGQDFVVSASAPGASGAGPISLYVGGPSPPVMLNPVSFASGVPAYATTGRLHAGATGTYTFSFQSASVTPPLFSGPYQFWSWAVNPAPEHVPSVLQPGTLVTGERIDRTGDLDRFTFSDTAGALISVFYLSAVPSHLDVGPAGGGILASIPYDTTDTSVYARSTGRLTLAQTGTYAVTVSGDGPLLADTGAYRLIVYPIDPRPERVAAAISPGDTVKGESIDVAGDVDEFTFTATAGQDYYAFLQAKTGLARTQMELDVVDSTNTVLGIAYSTGADTSLRLQMTPRINVATTRTLRLRVEAPDTSTGPYQLLLYVVNTKPESRPDTIALGDSLSGESLDIPGDVDQFRIHVVSPTNVNVIASYQGFIDPSQAWLGVTVTDSATGAAVASATASSDTAVATGGFEASPGTYLVRVGAQGYAGRPVAWGPYRLWVVTYSSGPETARDTIVIGDTVQGEGIDVPGDVDTYHVYGQRGAHLNVLLQGLVPSADNGWFGLNLYPPGASLPTMFLVSPGYAPALTDHQMVRYDLPVTGWYSVTLVGGRVLPVPVAPFSPYRFAIVPIASAPETHAASLSPGDSVGDESIDFLGDVDRFTVTASPGQLLYLAFGTAPSVPCCAYPVVIALDPSTGDTLAKELGQFLRVSKAFAVPAGGAVTVEVSEPPHVLPAPTLDCSDATCGGLYAFTGPYTLQVLPMDSLPELASPAYILGDTISTEAIAPVGDVDQFTLTATPGDTLSEWFRLRAAPVPSGGYLMMEVLDAVTGAVLSGANTGVSGSTADFLSWGSFIVPPSGRVLIRFLGASTIPDGAAGAPYAFYIKRGF